MKLEDCKVGMLVEFIDKNEHKFCPQYYPPVGTVGTILRVGPDDIFVRWPEGKTNKPNEWYCNAQYVEKVQELLTDGEIWDMLSAKMEKNGVKVDCFRTEPGDFPSFSYPLYSKEALIRAVALAYRVGYKRAEKGRPFKYGDRANKVEKTEKTKRRNGHWEPVDPNNLPPVGSKLKVARPITSSKANPIFTIGNIYYRVVDNVNLSNPYKELWVAKKKNGDKFPRCSSEYPERFDYWVED